MIGCSQSYEFSERFRILRGRHVPKTCRSLHLKHPLVENQWSKLLGFRYTEKNTIECTLPETNSSPLKMDGWNTSLSYWGCLFSGAMLVSGSVVFLWLQLLLVLVLQGGAMVYVANQCVFSEHPQQVITYITWTYLAMRSSTWSVAARKGNGTPYFREIYRLYSEILSFGQMNHSQMLYIYIPGSSGFVCKIHAEFHHQKPI